MNEESNQVTNNDSFQDFPNCKEFFETLRIEKDKVLECMISKFKKNLSIYNENILNSFENKISFSAQSLHKEFDDVRPKYNLRQMNKSESDYKLLQVSLMYKLRGSEVSESPLSNQISHIYRVVPTDKKTRCTSFPSFRNLLLLHGTNGCNVRGILKDGLMPSHRGLHGAGVYLTNSCSLASNYGRCYGERDGKLKQFTYFFVVEVQESEKMKTIPKDISKNLFPPPKQDFQEYSKNPPKFEKFEGSLVARKGIDFCSADSQDKFDTEIRIIEKGTFYNMSSVPDIFLSHHNLTVPVYLIEIEDGSLNTEMTLDLFKFLWYDYEQALENIFKFLGLPTNSKSNSYRSKYIKSYKYNYYNKHEECFDKKKIISLLKEQIITLSDKKIDDFVTDSTKVHKRNLCMIKSELLFDVHSYLSQAAHDFKYTTLLLKHYDHDYKFVLKAISYSQFESSGTNLTFYRISSKDQDQSYMIQNCPLFLHGLKLQSLKSILMSGFEHTNKSKQSLLTLSNDFNFACDEKDACFGRSKDNPKKFNFVMISATKKIGLEENQSGEPVKKKEKLADVKDSRGCWVFGCNETEKTSNNFEKKNFYISDIETMHPAYLIVVEHTKCVNLTEFTT